MGNQRKVRCVRQLLSSKPCPPRCVLFLDRGRLVLGVVRGLILAGAISLGIIPSVTSVEATPVQHDAQYITVISYEPTTTTTTVALVHHPVAPPSVRPPEYVDAHIMAMWSKVAQCESGKRWYQVYSGSHSFSGALGIRNDVWLEHGGGEFGATAGNASPTEQVIVARRIQARGGVPNFVPDQDGNCRGW